jgi:hypothetical protein
MLRSVLLVAINLLVNIIWLSRAKASLNRSSSLAITLDEKGLQLVKRAAFEYLKYSTPMRLSRMKETFGPEILNGSIEIDPLFLERVDFNESNLVFNITKEVISLTIRNLSMDFNATMVSRVAGGEHKADYKISAVGVELELDFNVSVSKLADPEIGIKKSSVRLRKVKVEVQGDMLHWVIGSMLRYAVGLANNYFQSYMVVELEKTLNRDLNKMIREKFISSVTIRRLKSIFNASLSTQPFIKTGSISLFTKGIFQPLNEVSTGLDIISNLSLKVEDIQSRNTTNPHLALYVGAPLLNSLFKAVHEAKLVKFAISHINQRHNQLVSFTTQGFETFFPRLTRNYSRKPVDIECTTGDAPRIIFEDTRLLTQVKLRCAVLVVNSIDNVTNQTNTTHHGDLLLTTRQMFSVYMDEELNARVKLENIELDEVFTDVNGVVRKPMIFTFMLKFRMGKLIMMGEIQKALEERKINVVPNEYQDMLSSLKLVHNRKFICVEVNLAKDIVKVLKRIGQNSTDTKTTKKISRNSKKII